MNEEQKKEGQQQEKPKAAPAGEGKAPPDEKAAAEKKPAAAAEKPKPPARPKPPAPEPLDNELVSGLRSRFKAAIGEATRDRAQDILVVSAESLLEVGRFLRDQEQFAFLTDLTAVDWYEREPRFDVILNLYSFTRNERVRLKVPVSQACPSVTSLWGTANWLERECYDMFGIVFEGHPDLKRILLPDGWKGYPLRKDYDILRQDTDWVRENLGIESGQ